MGACYDGDVPIEDKIIWCVPVGAKPQGLVTVIDPDWDSIGPIQWLSESVVVT
jgi:hypothetical protein